MAARRGRTQAVFYRDKRGKEPVDDPIGRLGCPMPELPTTSSTEARATQSYEEFLEDIKGLSAARKRGLQGRSTRSSSGCTGRSARRSSAARPRPARSGAGGRRGWCSGCRPTCGRLSPGPPVSRPRTSRVCGLLPWLGQRREISHTVCKTFRGGTSSSWCRSLTKAARAIAGRVA